ncbi:cell division protein FtsA [Candidatus Woesebacteria bacterium]|nr:cell division protein FtsA [Candidatus Woesebacteria bacterium]
MPQTSVITAIDVGTDKCVTLIASHALATNELRVLGVSAVPSRGMRKSQIIDLEQVLGTISESLDGAERMAGMDVKSAYVSVSGAHIGSLNSKGVVAVASPDQEIIQEDVDRVIEAARAISLSSEREIIHVIPKDFKVDSQEGIKDPVGMTGVRLESEAHIITGMSTALRNLEKCLHDLGLTVDGFVFAGLASSQVVLSETEKELGIAVIDIGAGSTSLCVYVDGSLEFTTCLPVGARHLTQDIALGCRVSIDIAEKIKLTLSSETHKPLVPHAGESKADFNKRRKKDDELRLSELEQSENTEVLSKRTILEGIMLPRMQEVFGLVSERLKANNLLSEIPAGVVITGGGAETAQIAEVAKRELNLPARIGKPVELQGLITDIHKPSYATSVGLLLHGKKRSAPAAPSSGFASLGTFFKSSNNNQSGSFLQKITDLIRSLLP